MKKQIIQKIRDDYSPQNNTERILSGYAESIKTLAEDLYAKDTHFIFELIQNAEDNDYEVDDPLLRFILSKTDLLGEKDTPALIVENNEIGFQQDHVEAICNVGQTTKISNMGYIGEKGIGFKSVFRLTSCPYIFSNGFHFSLPEKGEFSGLGYIVPSWIDSPPINLDKKITSIFLPLDKPDFPRNKIITTLQDIAPETILFLNKLKSIEVEVNLGDDHYEMIIERDDSNLPLVRLTYLKKTDKDDTCVTQLFWVEKREFAKPQDINHENRANVQSREVSVAIPLDEVSQGKLFAYLPVWENTGLPFLINADFLLVSSREGLKESEPWNLWLRKCISEVYSEALVSCLSSETLPFKQRIKAYASLPRETNHGFLQPIIQEIQQELERTECIFTAPSKLFSLPFASRIAPSSFWDLIGDGDFPKILSESIRLVCPELEPFSKAIKSLGVSSLKKEEVLGCLDDFAWVSCQSDSWLLDLYRYLIKHKIEDNSLAKKEIVKIRTGKDESFLSCSEQQPIYFWCDYEVQKAMDDVPEWLKKFVPFAFLDKCCFQLISEQADSEEIKAWMTKCFEICTFTIANYCVDIIRALRARYDSLSSQQIAEATSFLVTHASDNSNWNPPIVLSDGQKDFPSGFYDIKIIVPEKYDRKTGWQNIWATENERQAFWVLSEDYNSKTVEHLLLHYNDNIKKYPDPERVIEFGYSSANKYEKSCISNGPDSTQPKTISNWRSPSTLRPEKIKGKNVSESLLAFLSNSKFDYKFAEIQYYHDTPKTYCVDSEFYCRIKNCKWLPTQKGFVRPAQAFLERKEIKEILGDTVPYFQGNLPEEILEFLGIKAELTVDELLKTLKAYSSDKKVNVEMVYRIYSQLEARTRFDDPGDIVKAFEEHEMVFIPESKDEGQWFTLDQVIWEDATSVLGDHFIYLQKHYPKLKTFFINTLGVKECADPESFAQRWTKLQDTPVEKPKELRKILEAVYRVLLPIAIEDESKRPDWWDGFVENALILTQNNLFERPSEVLVPDDGELKRLFSKADVNFVWRPEKDSFNHWAPFHEAFNIPRISKSVTFELSSDGDRQIKSNNDFITESAIIMLAAWLREKDSTYYNHLFENGVFHDIIELEEATTEQIKILFTLETDGLIKEIEEDYPVFWDRKNGLLILGKQATPSDLKRKTATFIARSLMSNRAYKDLAHWIELIIGADNINRLRDDGWSAPTEVVKLLKKEEPNSKSHEENKRKSPKDRDSCKDEKKALSHVVDVQGDEHSGQKDKPMHSRDGEPSKKKQDVLHGKDDRKTTKEEKAPRYTHQEEEDEESSIVDEDDSSQEAEPDYGDKQAQRADLLNKFKGAFNKLGAVSISEECEDLDYFAKGDVKNVVRRRQRSTAAHSERMRNEPTPEERRRETMRIILEPADSATKSYLENLYAGKCQICHTTFPQRNGSPFFVATHLVERKHARLFDNYANALCLCPLHFAQWRHGTVEADDIIDQILSKKTKAEGAHEDLSLKIKLCGKELSISYKEKHLVDLQSLLTLISE